MSRLRPLALLLVFGNLSCRGPGWTPEAPPPREPEGLATPELVAFMPEDDITPRGSANGRYVAFVSAQNGNLDVWVRDYARRSTYPLTLDGAADFDPDIAPAGDRLVFVSRRSDAKGDLYLSYGLETGAKKERLTHEGSRDRQPTFAPDGRHIYFTQAYGVGDEAIAVLDLETRETRRVSPGPGFDPAVSPDGRYLIYTEPGVGRAEHPHLTALRVTDSATRAVTAADSPAGFARFAPAGPAPGTQRLVFNRFGDDDDASGHLDAEDRASLWRLDVRLDALFERRDADLRPPGVVSRPFPLTDGSDDELFADVAAGFIYFAQGSLQQDIFRLPLSGIFPEHTDPLAYFALAETLEDPRTRWFAYRAAWATAAPGSLPEAQALLAIGRLQEERGRADMAADAYRQLIGVRVASGTADPRQAERAAGRRPAERGGTAPPARDPRDQIAGLAEVALASLERKAQVAAAAGPEDRARATRVAMRVVGELADAYPDAPAVQARVALERAEILVDRGARVQAAEDLEALVQRFPSEEETAARALLFRIDLLGVAYAPEAISEAYRRVMERFPGQRAVVREAAGRIVDAHLGRLDTRGEPRAELDALRRLVERYTPGPVRSLARWQVVQRMEAQGLLTEATVELERLIAEAGQDRLAAAQALRRLARLRERLEREDEALEAWRTLRRRFGDLPGFGAEARDAITRVSQAQARVLEQSGDFAGARDAYHQVIDNDVNQVEAHRRYFALSARVGKLDEALDEAETRAERSSQTPVAHYAYGLALTWTDPPRLSDALTEVERALALNPQLVQAYITRGWIREMQELEEPSFFTRAKDAVVEGVGRALGGLLDVEIGQAGLLEQALDDYKTALRLNPESVDPATEAQILLNLGNGHYRLAEKTNDLGNMRNAFERYLEAWRLGLTHRDARTELVFYERLGRAASWVDEPAVGAMATRRALAVARGAGVSRRDAQLYGNLALTYTLANEDAYARDALARFEAFRAEAEARSGLVVAARDRARARLDTVSVRDADQLEGILEDLATGRRWLAGLTEMDRGELPTVWLALSPDATRAQYGFDRITEEDLNLSMAEAAHRALGEVGRAQDVRRLRAGLTARIIEDVPGAALGFGEKYPTPLGVLRERLGLLLAEVRARHARGRPEEAEAGLDAARAELEAWLGDDRYAADRPALRVDLARLAAVSVELYVARPPAGAPAPRAPGQKLERVGPAERREALDELLADADAALTAATATTAVPSLEGRPELPEALDTPEALAATASVAVSLPRWAGVEREARAARARLAYARALLALKDAAAPQGEPSLQVILQGLDRTLDATLAAEAELKAAAHVGAEAGPGLGLRVSALALAALADVERVRGRPELAKAATDAALGMARAAGEQRLYWRIRLGAALVGTPAEVDATLQALAGALPQQVGVDLAPRLFTRSASAALARGDITAAFAALDRGLLFAAAAGGPVVEARVEGLEPDVAKATLRAHAVLADARSALARTDARTPRERFEALSSSVRQAWARAGVAPAKGVQDLGAIRLLGRAREPEELEFELAPSEALLLAAPVQGDLHLFLIDGSTTAEATDARWRHAVAEVPAAQVIRDLAAVRESLAAGVRASPNRLSRLNKALLEPVAAGLVGKRHLYVVSTALGGPLPLTLFDPKGPVPCHLSAPTLLAVVKAAQLVGVSGTLAVADPDAPPLAPDARRLGPDDMLPFRRGGGSPGVGAELGPGEARALDARPAVEALADRAVAAVVVEAPVRLEPRALERSVVALGEAGGAPDAFQAELPLVDLDLPAQLLVLGRVTRTGAGWDSGQVTDPAWVRLDVPLLARGYATTVLLPATAPPDAVGRLVQALLARAPEVGPARALMDAVEAERAAAPQLALATLVGSPGLDAAGTKAYAEVQVRAARTRAIALLNQNQVEEAVPAFERWIRMQLVANDTKYLVTAFKALVAVLERRLANPDFARAAETQEWLLRVLEESKAAPGEVADATIDLAYLYSRAHDNAKAEATFERIITQLTAAGDAVRVGRAWYKYGLYHREALRYEQAAEALERAISIWVRAGQYDKKEIPADPARALREVGEIYLNRLSDPVRAKRAYERALRYADGAERRVGVVIDLVRVARRRGDFQVASQLADQAQGEAAAKKLEDLELSALIEAANVAWYQGDYRRGAALCQESLTKVDRLLKALKKPQAPSTLSDQRQLLRRRIYALSVCGLVSMSQRDEEQALEYLQQALRTSQSIGDERETATQLNNLGRVYLEFGRVRPSVESFQRARAIDERLEDRYALAYDLRNLGRALLLQGRYDESEQALTTALTYAQEVRDTNNELRARFALGELYAARDRPEEAAATWQAALPLAEALDVKELSWQIHRALAARARAEGRLADAETSLLEAVRIARSITGRAASSALSPDRTAPFDDLARLYLDTDKAEAAFLVVDQARLLAQLELLDDARIPFRDPAVPGLLGRLRAASTASTAEALGAALRAADPRVGALVRREAASSLAARLPEGTAILAYRITEGALLGFLVDGRGLKVAQAEVPAADLAALIQDYSSRLEARADLATVSARLGELLLAPFAGRLSGTRRVAVVAQGALRYVAFPALPLGEGLLVDQASVIQALDPAAAADALAAPLGPLAARPLIALGGAPSNEAPLPFADRELTVMQEELPQVVLVRGAGADRKRLLDSLGAARGVWHFAGHADLARAATDPLGGVLLASDGPVGMLELLARRTEAELVVLSACRTRLGGRDPDLDGSDLLSLAEVLHLAGAGHVLATTLRVEDVAAALVMKRFYRAARDVPAAEALQAAQQAVRARYPHPAWWAGFTLSAGR